jgi:hypothetical protein
MHKQRARQNLIDALRLVVDALGPIYALKRRDRREPGRREKEQAEERFTLLMRRHFRRQWARVREQLGEQYPDRKSLKAVDIPDDDDLEDLIRALTEMLRGGVALFGSRAKPAIDYTLTNKEAAQAAREYAYELVRGINDTTRDALRDAVNSFVETPGMTLGDLEDQVSVHFGEGRAERIAITEVTRAYATGQQMAGEALRAEFPDVRVVKVWFTNADDIVCPVCAPLDGKEVGIDESFESGIDNPPAHPNCRCWTESSTALAELGERELAGIPVGPNASSFVNIETTNKEISGNVKAALRNIEGIHGSEGMKPVTVITTNSKQYGGGYFDPQNNSIAILKGSDHQRMTFAHEYGHAIDTQLIGIGRQRPGENILLAEFEKATANSDQLRKLNDLLNTNEIAVMDRGLELYHQVDHTVVNYYLRPEEVWARAYSQYIAEKSADPQMLSDLAELSKSVYPRQWETEDFKPISKAIDGIMEKLGWRE